MKKFLLLIVLLLVPLLTFASDDRSSLMRGAKSFKTLCMTCHALRMLQYNSFAKKAGITIDLMPAKDKEWWFAKAPPDLSLTVSQHGADWIYTYLQVFYQDPAVKIGSNNLLVPHSSMPNLFLGLQGKQELNANREKALNEHWRKPHYYSLLNKTSPGSMTNEQLEQTVADITNFLAYASAPSKLQRERTGVWVILFLVVFLVLAYFLKREYWKDIE